MVIVVIIVLFRRLDGYLCLASDENHCQRGHVFDSVSEPGIIIKYPPGHSSSCSNMKQYCLYIITIMVIIIIIIK